ncbi:MAG: copper chaperone PCu(A)C [Woeseiaceae bacterium]|nr:copper chaperone PCu(A)C [Woeseiaceae bacterium]
MSGWRRATGLFAVLLALTACGRGDDAATTVEDAHGYAPLARGTPAVAYFRLVNRGATARTVTAVTSDAFGRAALHETIIDGGVARMVALDSLLIAADSTVEFAPGGRHVMLHEPRARVAPGTVVTLQIGFADGERLRFEVTLADRAAGAGNGT